MKRYSGHEGTRSYSIQRQCRFDLLLGGDRSVGVHTAEHVQTTGELEHGCVGVARAKTGPRQREGNVLSPCRVTQAAFFDCPVQGAAAISSSQARRRPPHSSMCVHTHPFLRGSLVVTAQLSLQAREGQAQSLPSRKWCRQSAMSVLMLQVCWNKRLE